jgi:hypothetical protein
MDTSGTAKMDVSGKIDEIKRFMPDTYRSIQAKAAKIGKAAYELVRRGLRGEANCFYAFERARVVGTPFDLPAITADVALCVVEFGCAHVCMFGASKGAADGAHLENGDRTLGMPSPFGGSTPPVGTLTATSHTGNSARAPAPAAGLGNSPVSSPAAGK